MLMDNYSNRTYTYTVYVKSFVVYLISCFSRMTKIHEIFPLNKLQFTKLITLQGITTHLMNYQHCALHASRAYVLEDITRDILFLLIMHIACASLLNIL